MWVLVHRHRVFYRLDDTVFGEDILGAAGRLAGANGGGFVVRFYVVEGVHVSLCRNASRHFGCLRFAAVALVASVAKILRLLDENGGKERQGRNHVLQSSQISLIFRIISVASTYADIEFDNTPEHKHGRVSVTKGDAVQLNQAQDGADGREETKQEDTDKTGLLASWDLERQEDRNGQDGDQDIGDDGDEGVDQRRLRQVDACRMRGANLELPGKVHRRAGKDQSKGATQMADEDGDDGDPDEDAVGALARRLQQTQVAEQQRNLEQTDAKLIDGAAGKVDLFVGWSVTDVFGSEFKRKTQSVFRLNDGQDGVDQGKEDGERGDVVVGGKAATTVAKP